MSFENFAMSSAHNHIRAVLAGKQIFCPFKRLSGGAIPLGKYKLSAPMKNMVYGSFVLLSPAQPARHKDWIAPVQPAWHKDWIAPVLSANRFQSAGGHSGWIEPNRAADWIENQARGADWVENPTRVADWTENPVPYFNQEGLFVVVGKPLTQRNAIFVTSGFDDFISALTQTHGSEITVS